MADDFDVLITAAEAWPAFERAVLDARREIVGAFRIFDMRTRLRSPEARAVGHDWFDLLAHALARDVRVTIWVSDFDPVLATDLHEQAWITVRQGVALAEVTGATSGRLSIRTALHPARAGVLPRGVFLWPVLRRKFRAMGRLKGPRLQRQAIGLRNSDLPDLHPVTHHQKLAVIDGSVLYLGGLDLNERRFDTPEHPLAPKDSWSDVQVIARGPEAGEALQHLESFREVSAGQAAPPDLRHLRRTLSAPRRFQMPFLSPRRILSEIEEAHLGAFARARDLIYIETQFFRSSVIAQAMAKAARRTPDLAAILILPSLPEEVAFDTSDGLENRYGLALQREALAALTDAFGARLTVASPVQPVLADRDGRTRLAGSPIIHVHNKVLTVDAEYGLVGSANLNGRSLHWDTEVALEIARPARVDRLRRRVMEHWWFDPLPGAALAPGSAQSWWSDAIRRNRVSRPENRTGFLVPYDRSLGEDLQQALPGVTEDIV